MREATDVMGDLHQGQSQSAQGPTTSWIEKAKKNAGWLIALGVIEIIAGILAIGSPLITGIAVTILVGAMLVVAGIARIISVFKADSFGSGVLAFIGGLLGTIAGFLLLARPGIGLATLTLLMAAYLIADGVSRVVLAFRIKPAGGWGWMVFGGLISVLLGLFIGWEWPLSGTWAIGTWVGVHLLVTGMSTISIGRSARKKTS